MCLKNYGPRFIILDQTIPKKKNARLSGCLRRLYKQLSKEEKRKSKGEKERYTQLNGEFQRIAWRDKKAFLNEQCKELEESNRKGMTSDRFKKIGSIKGTFHPKMGSIKDRDSKDLIKAEEIKKRWQE